MSLSNQATSRTQSRHEADEMAAVFANMTVESDIQLFLYREFPRGTLSYLTTFTPKTFSLKRIRRQYGGGHYWLYGKRDGCLVKKRRFTIEGDPIIRTRARGLTTTAGTALGRVLDQVPAELRTILEKLETIEERQRQLLHLMTALNNRGQGRR